VGLSREVIRRGRPIITQDYENQCRTLGVNPIASGISAWMGVPLNAGAESIGALSVGNRDPLASYTPAQLELLHAIADQTAGAIVKARLLRETENRASQLSALNEVTRQLASIRELGSLRRSVIDGASGILGCEAGIFYSVEEPGGEMVVPSLCDGENVKSWLLPWGMLQVLSHSAPSIDNEIELGSGHMFWSMQRNSNWRVLRFCQSRTPSLVFLKSPPPTAGRLFG
jgi:hypothetical protein